MSALLAIRPSSFCTWHPATMLAGEFWAFGDRLTGLQILQILSNQKDWMSNQERRPMEVRGWSYG